MRAGRSPSRRCAPSPASRRRKEVPADGAGGAEGRGSARGAALAGAHEHAARSVASNAAAAAAAAACAMCGFAEPYMAAAAAAARRILGGAVRGGAWRRLRSPAWRHPCASCFCCPPAPPLPSLLGERAWPPWPRRTWPPSWRSPCPSSWRRRRRRWRRRRRVDPRAGASSARAWRAVPVVLDGVVRAPDEGLGDLRHLFPNARCAMISARSSSRDHSSRLMSGFRWLYPRSRHCLPCARGAAERSSPLLRAELANELDDLRVLLLRPGALHELGFRTFCQRCRHCTSVRSSKYSAARLVGEF